MEANRVVNARAAYCPIVTDRRQTWQLALGTVVPWPSEYRSKAEDWHCDDTPLSPECVVCHGFCSVAPFVTCLTPVSALAGKPIANAMAAVMYPLYRFARSRLYLKFWSHVHGRFYKLPLDNETTVTDSTQNIQSFAQCNRQTESKQMPHTGTPLSNSSITIWWSFQNGNV